MVNTALVSLGAFVALPALLGWIVAGIVAGMRKRLLNSHNGFSGLTAKRPARARNRVKWCRKCITSLQSRAILAGARRLAQPLLMQ